MPLQNKSTRFAFVLRITTELSAIIIVAIFMTTNSVFANTDIPTCLLALDTLIANNKIDSPEKLNRLSDELENLNNSCPPIPQIRHNLGVINAHNENWETAAGLFKSAIELEPRTQLSYTYLGQIYKYRATLAYRDALQSSGTAPKPPHFKMQTAKDKNFDARIPIPFEGKRDYDRLKPSLLPLLQSWWKHRLDSNIHCDDCFTEEYKMNRSHIYSTAEITTLPEQNKSAKLPDFLLQGAGQSLLVTLKDTNAYIHSLRIEKTISGWRISDEQQLP